MLNFPPEAVTHDLPNDQTDVRYADLTFIVENESKKILKVRHFMNAWRFVGQPVFSASTPSMPAHTSGIIIRINFADPQKGYEDCAIFEVEHKDGTAKLSFRNMYLPGIKTGVHTFSLPEVARAPLPQHSESHAMTT